MKNEFKSPFMVMQDLINTTNNKYKNSTLTLFIKGFLAGVFIAVGASASSVAMHGITNVGISRTVAGTIFPVGLMGIILVGGELFTGDCLMIVGVLDGKDKMRCLLKKLILVFLSNMAGVIITVLMIHGSGLFDYSSGALGAYTIKAAVGKVNLSFTRAFLSGVLCNIVVCLAVLMAAAANDITGKICSIFFPIFAFVICGFEHCIANMYYIPAGILAAGNSNYVSIAIEKYGFTIEHLNSLNWGNFIYKNLLPVTLGNMVGGMLFIAIPLYYIYKEDKDKTVNSDLLKKVV